MTNAAEELQLTTQLRQEDSQRDLYLTFHLHGEDYGIAISYVTEIIGIQNITNLPGMPESIKGVINLRGRVIPVMDVRISFGQPYCDYDERTCVIVVEVNGKTTGLVVDRVKEVVEISAEQIEPAPQCGTEVSYVEGMGKIGGEVKILLDIEALVGLDPDLDDNGDQVATEQR